MCVAEQHSPSRAGAGALRSSLRGNFLGAQCRRSGHRSVADRLHIVARSTMLAALLVEPLAFHGFRSGRLLRHFSAALSLASPQRCRQRLPAPVAPHTHKPDWSTSQRDVALALRVDAWLVLLASRSPKIQFERRPVASLAFSRCRESASPAELWSRAIDYVRSRVDLRLLSS